jgi:hypothetical protein
MNLSKKRLGCCVLALCIAGAEFTIASVIPAPAALAADQKKEDNGEKIALEKVPKAVIDAVKKDTPGARVTKAFIKQLDGKTVYILDDVKAGKKGWDFTVAEDGKILKKEECHDE